MKRGILLFGVGLFSFLLLSGAILQTKTSKSAILTVVSTSGDSVAVSFEAAYVVGGAGSYTPMSVTTLTTPLRLEIDSPHFMGIFKKKSGPGSLLVRLSKPGSPELESKGVVVNVTMIDDKLSSTHF